MPMYRWKSMTFALCLVSVPLAGLAEPPDHASNKKSRAADNDRPMRQSDALPVEGAARGAPDTPHKQPPLAAAGKARGQQPDSLHDMRSELGAGQGNINSAAERLEQAGNVRDRAEQARSRTWSRWKAKLLSEDAIDPKVQHELEKHARREAKLQRLAALAKEAGDAQALDRLAKLQALEATLHEKHMSTLMAKSDRVEQEEAQP